MYTDVPALWLGAPSEPLLVMPPFSLIRIEPAVADGIRDNSTLLCDSFPLTNYHTVIAPPMGKITGLWLSAMTLLAVVAVSTAPVFGPGVAAASNHETAAIEVTDASATKTNSSGIHDAPFSVVSGMEFQVELTAENTGDSDGTKQVAVTADGEEIEQADVAVGGGQQTTETVPVTLDDTGEYDLAVDGVPAGTVTVVEPPNITVTETTVDRATVTRGETIEVTHTLENTGGQTGELTIIPKLENTDTGASRMVNELAVKVGGGDTETTSWTLDTGTLDELPAGAYELRDVPARTRPSPSRNPAVHRRVLAAKRRLDGHRRARRPDGPDAKPQRRGRVGDRGRRSAD